MADLLPGAKVKQYTLETLLGRGASGEVWRATDGSKPVAIKFMNEALMRSEAAAKHRQRMEREVRALSSLQHPNITALYDYDLEYAPPYLVMEYVDSPSYEQLISSGENVQVPVTQRLTMLESLASALTTAHAVGIIHRDIKPGNMNGVDHPYLLDFSIALEQENVEHTNFNIGTTIYMTPDEEPPDRLSDNFSFALVAYEVLFGVHPIFPPDDTTRGMGAYARLQAFQRLKNRDWRFPSRVPKEEMPLDLRGADLAALDSVFEKSLSARDKRYSDLGQFVNDIKAAVLVPANMPFIKQAEQRAVAVPVVNLGAVVTEDYTRAEAERASRIRSTTEEVRAVGEAPKPPSQPIDWEKYSTIEAAIIEPDTVTVAPPKSSGLVGWLRGIFGRKV